MVLAEAFRDQGQANLSSCHIVPYAKEEDPALAHTVPVWEVRGGTAGEKRGGEAGSLKYSVGPGVPPLTPHTALGCQIHRELAEAITVVG